MRGGKIGLPLKVKERKVKPFQVSDHSFLNIQRGVLKAQGAATIMSGPISDSFHILDILSNCLTQYNILTMIYTFKFYSAAHHYHKNTNVDKNNLTSRFRLNSITLTSKITQPYG